MTDLENATYSNTKTFSFNGIECDAKIVKVYDGDTCTAVMKYNSTLYKFTIRMDGYDAPEIRSHNKLEKKYGLKSRDYLRSLILNKIVTLKCLSYDKYGRILGLLTLNSGEIVNDMMIEHGWSIPYDGGHKMNWDDILGEWELIYTQTIASESGDARTPRSGDGELREPSEVGTPL